MGEKEPQATRTRGVLEESRMTRLRRCVGKAYVANVCADTDSGTGVAAAMLLDILVVVLETVKGCALHSGMCGDDVLCSWDRDGPRRKRFRRVGRGACRGWKWGFAESTLLRNKRQRTVDKKMSSERRQMESCAEGSCVAEVDTYRRRPSSYPPARGQGILHVDLFPPPLLILMLFGKRKSCSCNLGTNRLIFRI